MSLKKILSKIEKELEEKESIKDELYDAMRKAIRLSKRAIFSVHKGKFEEAKRLLREAKAHFAKLETVPPVHQKLVYAGIVDAAFQEYSEAHIFLSLTKKGKYVGPEKITVPSTSYLLGLADVVGELRRRTLDSLRKGNVEAAEKTFEAMEHIYNEMIAMEESMHAVSEFRRKSDITRRIIESTRGDVTIETRRSSLEHSIKKLEKALRKTK